MTASPATLDEKREAPELRCPMCGYDVTATLGSGHEVCPECAGEISYDNAWPPPPAEPAARGAFAIIGWWLAIVFVGVGLSLLPRSMQWWHWGTMPVGFLFGWLLNVSFWLFVASWLLLAWSDNLVRALRWQDARFTGWRLLGLFVPTYFATLAGVVAARLAIGSVL
jgi:hypothetical protein